MIGEYAFGGCYYLEAITYLGTQDEWSSIVKATGWDQNAGSSTDSDGLVILCMNGEYDPSAPESFTSGLVFSLNAEHTAYEVKYYHGSDTVVIIPATYNGLPVVSIRSSAFSSTVIESVTIPASITSIGNDAFSDCDSLAAVVFAEGATLTTIGERAFRYCDALKEITIPKSVTTIGAEAFYICSVLETVSFEDGISIGQINDYTFYGCFALSSISYPNTLTSIGESAFYQCSGLSEFSIPASVQYIGKKAFYECMYLKSPINIPNGVTSIEEGTFYHCWSIPSLTIPNSVTKIGTYAFENCGKLNSITIPKSVTSIGGQAFNLCYSLAQIVVEEGNPIYDSRNNCNAIIQTATNTLIQGSISTSIPSTVTVIEPYAFAYGACPAHLVIPKSVTTMYFNSFYQCYNLAQIEVEAGNPNYDSRDNCNAIIETASNNLVLGCASTIIPNSVTGIGDYAFDGCSELKAIVIPDKVEQIGYGAFYGCHNATSLHLGSGLKSIGDYAFNGCSMLTSVVIPDNVESIGYCAFMFCRSISYISIGTGVRSSSDNCFYFCSDIKTVICKLTEVPDSWWFDRDYPDATLYVPAESLDAYKEHYMWNIFGTILPLDQAPSGVEDIPTTEINGQIRAKVMHNGQILIRHEGKTYNMMGNEIK
jgi:hypothetical protein